MNGIIAPEGFNDAPYKRGTNTGLIALDEHGFIVIDKETRDRLNRIEEKLDRLLGGNKNDPIEETIKNYASCSCDTNSYENISPRVIINKALEQEGIESRKNFICELILCGLFNQKMFSEEWMNHYLEIYREKYADAINPGGNPPNPQSVQE